MNSLILDLFVDKEEYINALINKYRLDTPLQKLIDIVNDRISNPATTGLNGIPSLFLTAINDKFLSNISDEDEKKEIEYIIREVAMHLLIKYIQSSSASKYEITKSLWLELRSACDYHGYDYTGLNRVFPIEDLVKFAKDTLNSSEENNLVVNPPVFWYDWNGVDYDLDTLSRDLKSQNIISGTKNFKELFKYHKGEMQVRFNRNNIDFIIVLFDSLYQKGLIIPKGINSGKFHPLKLYAVDFDEKPLLEKEPKAIKYRIVKNKANYSALSSKVEKWTKSYKID